MRAFSKGKPFMDVESEHHVPGESDLAEMQKDIAEARQEGRDLPVFSEAYLYPRLGKDDARFLLGVAEEYAAIIDRLGAREVLWMLEKEGLVGRDDVLMDKLTKELLAFAGKKYPFKDPIRVRRGYQFELQVGDGHHVARVTVQLDRVE